MKSKKSSFSCKLTKLANKESDKLISLAGLEKLKPLLPKEIDLDKNPDLIGVVLNAAVGNYANKNGDSVTNKTLVDIADNFQWKFVNTGHDRGSIIGVICNVGFSKFEDNTILTRDEVIESSDPVNLSLALLLWKPAINEEFAEFLEESADERSPDYGSISASWELYFDEYDIAISPNKSLAEAKIISEEKEKNEFEKYLRANEGRGRDAKGNYIFRVIKHDKDNIIYPVGVGLVEVPAAPVRGLAIVDNEKEKQQSTASVVKDIEKNDKEESQKNKISVSANNERQHSIKANMKFPFLNTITDADTRESLAGSIDQLISQELQKENEKYLNSLSAKEKEAADAKAALEDLKTSNAQVEDKLKTVSADFNALQEKYENLANEIKAQKDEVAFNTRMGYFDENFALNDKTRAIVASKIKGLDESGFNEVKAELEVLLPAKEQAAPETKPGGDAGPEGKELKTAIASAKADPETAPLPNAADNATQKTHKEMADEAFKSTKFIKR